MTKLKSFLFFLVVRKSHKTISGYTPSTLGVVYKTISEFTLYLKKLTYKKYIYKSENSRNNENWLVEKNLIESDLLRPIFILFDKGEYNRTVNTLSTNDLNLIKEQLSQIRDKVLKKIQDLEGVFFRVKNYEVHRSFPGNHKDAGPSYKWHHDYVSKDSFKIFIYGNNQTKKNGATTLINASHTKKIMDMGFNTLVRDKCQFILNNDIVSNAITVEGSQGDVLFWKNSLIHRGNLPLIDHRDLIVFEVVPSYKSSVKKNLKAARISFVDQYKNIFNDILKSI